MAKGDFKWYALSAAIGAGTLALMMWGCGQNQADESADVQPVEPVKEVVVPAEDARDAEIAKLRDSLAFVNGQLDECRNGKRCPGVTPQPKPQPKPQPRVEHPQPKTPIEPAPKQKKRRWWVWLVIIFATAGGIYYGISNNN